MLVLLIVSEGRSLFALGRNRHKPTRPPHQPVTSGVQPSLAHTSPMRLFCTTLQSRSFVSHTTPSSISGGGHEGSRTARCYAFSSERSFARFAFTSNAQLASRLSSPHCLPWPTCISMPLESPGSPIQSPSTPICSSRMNQASPGPYLFLQDL